VVKEPSAKGWYGRLGCGMFFTKTPKKRTKWTAFEQRDFNKIVVTKHTRAVPTCMSCLGARFWP